MYTVILPISFSFFLTTTTKQSIYLFKVNKNREGRGEKTT